MLVGAIVVLLNPAVRSWGAVERGSFKRCTILGDEHGAADPPWLGQSLSHLCHLRAPPPTLVLLRRTTCAPVSLECVATNGESLAVGVARRTAAASL